MSNSKINLNLNEENELAFKISIEGSSSDIESTKPKFRFVVTEQGKENGVFYPAVEGDDGFVTARLPDNGLFSEKKNYLGKLEVFLGNHYFVPTEVDIEFIKPLKVEGAVVTNKKDGNTSIREEKNKIENNEKPLSISAVEVRKNNPVTPKNKNNNIQEEKKERAKTEQVPEVNNTKRKRKWSELTKEEQKRVVAFLKEKKRKELLKKRAMKQKKEKLEEMKLKKQLKELMGTSLKGE